MPDERVFSMRIPVNRKHARRNLSLASLESLEVRQLLTVIPAVALLTLCGGGSVLTWR